VGNIRTALINYLFAQASGGEFILRLDDTDRTRSKPEFEDGIREDLRWLGLDWSEEFTQYARMERYAEAAEQLKAAGRLYPCYETSEELDVRRKLQVSRGRPPVYDRAALKLTEVQKAEYAAQGRTPHWRFLLEEKEILWNDLIRGEQKFSGQFTYSTSD
jgi:glutamyl-tRNA synthetase